MQCLAEKPSARLVKLLIFQVDNTWILYLHKSHNTPLLFPKNLHRHCFRLLLGNVHVPGEIANNEYANFWRVKEVHYGIVQVVNDKFDMN